MPPDRHPCLPASRPAAARLVRLHGLSRREYGSPFQLIDRFSGAGRESSSAGLCSASTGVALQLIDRFSGVNGARKYSWKMQLGHSFSDARRRDSRYAVMLSSACAVSLHHSRLPPSHIVQSRDRNSLTRRAAFVFFTTFQHPSPPWFVQRCGRSFRTRRAASSPTPLCY